MHHRRLRGCAGALALLLGMSVVPLTGAAVSSAAAADTWAVPDAPATLTITTAGGAAVDTKTDYVPGTMSLQGVEHPLRIRGRGNSTWGWPKKPYRLKLDTAASLLGMPAEKDWVLLANYGDPTSLRNHLALALGSRTALPWTPRARYVDVVLNGEAIGNYLMTEQVEQGKDRVALPEGGLLLEVDQRMEASGDPGFRSDSGLPIAFNDPDDLDDTQQQQVRRAVSAFEKALYGKDFKNPVTGYAAHVDLASFVDWYLLNELFKNIDADFFSSVFVTWTPGGRFAMGPPWDFDLSSGFDPGHAPTATDPRGWWLRAGAASEHAAHDTHWLARMSEDPAFLVRVANRWWQLRPVVDSLVAQIPATARVLEPSLLQDWTRWRSGGDFVTGTRHADSRTGEIDRLARWLTDRAAWMSAELAKAGGNAVVTLAPAQRTVSERAGTVQLTVTRKGNTRVPASVRLSRTSGTATPGSDFVLPPATVSFAPGEVTRTVALRILDDARGEGAETVRISLAQPGAGTSLGSPAASTFTIAASDQQPDLQVSTTATSGFVGNNVYNTTAARQAKSADVRRGKARNFIVRIQNDGAVTNTFRLTGSRAVAGSVSYLHGTNNVTRSMLAATGYPVTVPAGGYRSVKVRIVPPRKAKRHSLHPATVRGSWVGDSARVDVVKAVARATR